VLVLDHRVEARCVQGAPTLVITLEGACVHGESVPTIAGVAEGRVAEAPEAVAAVLDVRGVRLDRCTCTRTIRPRLEPLTWLFAASERGAATLGRRIERDWEEVGAEWVVSALEPAIGEVARRWAAREHVLHHVDGAIARRARWEARGQSVIVHLREGGTIETLWVGRRRIESVWRNRAGALQWRHLWPFLDGTGAENDAYRLEAHLEIHGTRLRAIDFAPESTGRPRSASWLSILAAHPSIEVLDLSGTDTTDADVAAALSACPELVELRLDRTRITVRALGYLLNARSLRRVLLRGCVLPYNKVRELEALRPDLALQHDGQGLP
jgi:hypothetical protein